MSPSTEESKPDGFDMTQGRVNDDRIVTLASEDLEHGALDTLTAFVVLSVTFGA